MSERRAWALVSISVASAVVAAIAVGIGARQWQIYETGRAQVMERAISGSAVIQRLEATQRDILERLREPPPEWTAAMTTAMRADIATAIEQHRKDTHPGAARRHRELVERLERLLAEAEKE